MKTKILVLFAIFILNPQLVLALDEEIDWNNPNWADQNFQNRLNTDQNARNDYMNRYGNRCSFKSTKQETDEEKINLEYSEDGLTHPKGPVLRFNEIPQGSLIEITKEGFKVYPPAGSTLDSEILDGVTIDTNSKDIFLKDRTKINGKLSYNNGQPFIKKGDEVSINGRKISSLTNNINIYSNLKDFNIEDHRNENFMYFDNEGVAFGSSNIGTINVEISSGDKIFNSDSKDKLNFQIKGGDMIEATSRISESKIPFVKHYHSDDGQVVLNNGRFTFKLNQRGINLEEIEEWDWNTQFYRGKYQSNPMTLVTDATSQNHQLNVNSANAFNILDQEGNIRVEHNPFGLTISESIEDNELQSYKDIKEKYPQSNLMSVYSDFKEIQNERPDLAKYLEKYSYFKDEDITPTMVQVIDRWYKMNPEGFEKTRVVINPKLGKRASGLGSRISIGTIWFDSTIPMDYGDRNINVFKALNHEYVHNVLNNVQAIQRQQKEKGIEVPNPINEVVSNIVKKGVKDLISNKDFLSKINDIKEKINQISSISNSRQVEERKTAIIENVEFINSQIKNGWGVNEHYIERIGAHLEIIRQITNSPNVGIMEKEYNDLVEKITGLPHSYSFTSGGQEVLTTWYEQYFDILIKKANSPNHKIREKNRELSKIAQQVGIPNSDVCAHIIEGSCQE